LSGHVAAYSAKLMGAKYLEWLRQRVILLWELLSDDGVLFLRTDYHFGHYMKVLIDETYGRSKFQNELIVNRIYKNVFGDSSFIPTSTDSVYAYFKSDSSPYVDVLREREGVREGFW
jgi:adenine-specific DNA-methyltransferase